MVLSILNLNKLPRKDLAGGKLITLNHIIQLTHLIYSTRSIVLHLLLNFMPINTLLINLDTVEHLVQKEQLVFLKVDVKNFII